MTGRMFPSYLERSLMGEAEGIEDDEEGDDDVKAGQSKYASDILRLWDEGFTPGQIDARLRCNPKVVKSVVMANGVTGAEFNARLRLTQGRKSSREAGTGAETPECRIGGLCPVEESLGGATPDQLPVAWPAAANDIKCATCRHKHVCRWVKICNEHPWIACRNWRGEEAS